MASSCKEGENLSENKSSVSCNVNDVADVEKKILDKIRSIEIYQNEIDEYNSDDGRDDVADQIYLPEISTVRRKVDKFHQQLLPIGNGLYNGTINEKLVREGLGTFSINNNEEYYSGEWKNDQYNGYGFNLKNNASIIYHGEFQNGILKEGYGKITLENGFVYKGEIKNGQFHDLGSLSIKISGLTEINKPNIEKELLKLVADWKEGKTERKLIYLNEIEEYYQYQYEVFSNSLQYLISSNRDNYQKQREYLQNLIDLYEKRLSELNLLNEIVTHATLPRKLKLSADLLLKLDKSYTYLSKYTQVNQKKTYRDCLIDVCQQGLKSYARRLAWSDDNENKFNNISSKNIFDKSLNSFLQASDFSHLKEVLYLNPFVVELIRKLICFANERLNRISYQYQQQFKDIQIKFIRNLWTDYLENLKSHSISEHNDDQYRFYSDCYSNILELSFIYQLKIQVNITLEIVIEVKLNEKQVFSRTSTDHNDGVYVLVFDEINQCVQSYKIFYINTEFYEMDDLENFIKNEIYPNEIFLLIVSFDARFYLTKKIRDFFRELGSTRIDQIHSGMAWIFIKRKNTDEIYEQSTFSFDPLFIERNFRINSNEDILIDQKIDLVEIESIIYDAMTFVLNHLKPWKNLQIQQWSTYLDQSVHENSSRKEIADHLLIKILQKGVKYVREHCQFNQNNNPFSTHLDLIIDYYRDSLIKDTKLNSQSRMKEIKNIFLYFLQIVQKENSDIEKIKILQLQTIKSFIEAKQSLIDIIDHFLSFNRNFSKLFESFQQNFSHDKHERFHKNSQEILSLLAQISETILQAEENSTEILEKYQTNNLEDAIRESILNKNIDDIKFLCINLDVDINQLDIDSRKKMLYLAIERKDEDFVLCLLEKGIDIDIKDKQKESLGAYAKQHDIDLIVLSNQIKNNSEKNSNLFENKLYAMQKMVNFFTNLGSLKFTWYVEHEQIKNFDERLFKKVSKNDIYEVLDLKTGKIKVKYSCPHYVLEVLIELLKIIKDCDINFKITNRKMIRLKAELIMAIEKTFNYFKDQVKYNSLETFKNDCITPFKDLIEDNNQSYQIFYNKLQKLDLFFLYNRKLKEITVDRALKSFQEENNRLLNTKKIQNAFLNYDKLFKKYFADIFDRKSSINHIVKETKKLAEKSKLDRDNIPSIIAGLAILLSLTVSDFIEKNSNDEYILKSKFNKNYLLQPHCIQILGVLMLLDIDGNQNSMPPNHLAQILTGQGKSWALALLGGFFSLIGFNVTIACYSDYLTRRDEGDFLKSFDCFKFTNEIQYKTFERMCNDKLSIKNKTLRGVISDIISGKDLSPLKIQEYKNSKSILLIDEVDIFFSNNFGKIYRAAVTIKNKSIGEIQKNLWEEIMSGNTDKTKLKSLIEQKLYSFIQEDRMISILMKSNFLKSHIEFMINQALEIYEENINNKNTLRDKYKIINDVIHVKNSDGKYISHEFHSYTNSLYYLKLIYDREGSFKHIKLNEESFGYLLITCGNVSYSELPNSYDGIYGVSGSLKNLSNGEQAVLKHYNINTRSYYPSFFGRSNLKFDKRNDFIIRETKQDWFNKIIIDTRDKICQERSILIFFENENLFDEFYNCYSGDLGVIPYFITLNKIFDGKEEKYYNDFDVNKLIKDQYAGHHGKVTLLTKDFGRGLDFQAETKVNEKGGIHIIQTFFSIDIKEEIQIKGRTARKDESGSYQLILYLDHLKQLSLESTVGKIFPFENVTKDTNYDELDKERTEKMDLFCQDKLKYIETNKEKHELTLKFFEEAITQCNENNREEFIHKIMELKF